MDIYTRKEKVRNHTVTGHVAREVRQASCVPMLKKSDVQRYIRIANDFYYGEDVIEAIRNAKSHDEISGIMCKARMMA